MNTDLNNLHPYPFEKLRALLGDIKPDNGALKPIALSVGEPKHQPPEFVRQALIDNIHCLANYPTTRGIPELSESIASWLGGRFNLNRIDPQTEVLPVNGTREALFAFAQAVVDRSGNPLVISPNPFYQIYEGAALLAGAEPYYLPCLPERQFIPDFDQVNESTWQRCQLLYLCSPGNPTGAVIDKASLEKVIALADQYDFVIASDECYSELYFDEDNPPLGLLDVCAQLGRNDYKRCVVFHSLSKRSNLPGLRSGFVAGDANILRRFFNYRTYHGCAMPLQHQHASIAAWSDEAHVRENRQRYREKFDAVLEILGGSLNVERPAASFYLWPQTPISDINFCQQLYAQQQVTVLPGQFLGREKDGNRNSPNPGANRVRMALVAPLQECIEAAQRIRQFVEGL